MVFELFKNYASVEHFEDGGAHDLGSDGPEVPEVPEMPEMPDMSGMPEMSGMVSCADLRAKVGDVATLFDTCNAGSSPNEYQEEDTSRDTSGEPDSIMNELGASDEASGDQEESPEDPGVLEDSVETFQGSNDFDEEEEFTTNSGRRLINLDLVLRSLLYASLFYILAHPDTYHGLIRRVFKRASRSQGLYVSMALFFVAYYALNLFI